MFGFGKRKSKGELSLVYDIGSDSVGGALVLFRGPEQKPKIIYTTRVRLPISEYPRSQKFKKDTLRAVRKVGERLKEDGIPHLKFTPYGRLRPRFAYCMLAAPWRTGQTRTIVMEKKNGFFVSKDLLEKLTAQEIEAFKNDPAVTEELAGVTPSVIESQIMEVRLNGYEVAKPYGKRAYSLVAEFFISVVPEEESEEITAAIQSTLPAQDIAFGSFPIVFFQVMRNMKNRPESFLLCDVNGEFSEISLVENGILAQTAVAPAGKRTLLRAMAEEMNTFPDEVLSRLEATGEQGEEPFSPQFIEAKKNAEKIWIDALRTAFNKIAPSSVLPTTVYLTADAEIEQWCKDILAREPTVINFSGAPLSTTIISTSYIASQCDFSEHARDEDVFLGFGTLYARMARYG